MTCSVKRTLATSALLSVLVLPQTAQAQFPRPSTILIKPTGTISPTTSLITIVRPQITSFRINAGAEIAADRVVVLDIVLGAETQGITHYRASESATFANTPWQTFTTRPTFTLSIGNGPKTIYLQIGKPATASSPALAVVDGMYASAVAKDVITFANPRLIGVDIAGGTSFTHSRTVPVQVNFEGNAPQYRAGETADLSAVPFRPLSNRRFDFLLSETPGIKRLYVQVANGTEYLSDTSSDTIELVAAQEITVPLRGAKAEATAEGYRFSARSTQGNWTCEIAEDAAADSIELRATPRGLLGTFTGADTCTFELFGGRKLANPWTIADWSYHGSTVPDGNEQVTKAPSPAGGQDMAMIVVWKLEGTGFFPTLHHRGLLYLKLNGPRGGDWRDAFE